MPTRHANLFAALATPFSPNEIRTRSGGGGRQLSYITARQAMSRLDEVVGPENWRNRHRLERLSDGVDAVVCTIEIKVDGEWVAKEDAGGFKEMTEKNRQGETVEDEENTAKTAYSDAFKRTAVLWGIGRHLYGDGMADFSRFTSEGAEPLPSPPRQHGPARAHAPSSNGNGHAEPERRNGAGQHDGKPPRSGKALFAWSKDREQEHDVALIKYLNGWAKLQDFPARMIDWDGDQVARAHAEAVRKLETVGREPGQEG